MGVVDERLPLLAEPRDDVSRFSCPTCKQRGQVMFSIAGDDPKDRLDALCEDCGGKGWKKRENCPHPVSNRSESFREETQVVDVLCRLCGKSWTYDSTLWRG